MPPALFTHSLYYLRAVPGSDHSGRCWLYSFYNAEGRVVLEARFPEIPGEVTFFESGKPNTPLLRLTAWRFFWWNGRYDVVDAGTGNVLGTLRRTGGIEAPDRRRLGQVRDAQPLRKQAFQSIVVGVADAILSEGSDSGCSTDAFQIEADKREIGTLRRTKLPFLQVTEPRNKHSGTGLFRWLSKLRFVIRKSIVPGGWRLDFPSDTADIIDPRVRLAAALLRIQIEDRYH